jgi:hypothetical protein
MKTTNVLQWVTEVRHLAEAARTAAAVLQRVVDFDECDHVAGNTGNNWKHCGSKRCCYCSAVASIHELRALADAVAPEEESNVGDEDNHS